MKYRALLAEVGKRRGMSPRQIEDTHKAFELTNPGFLDSEVHFKEGKTAEGLISMLFNYMRSLSREQLIAAIQEAERRSVENN